jgi:hypothetical protein
MADHAWCHDPARDAAVRAAEDGRAGPLPTLGQCIDGMFSKSGSPTSAPEQENKGDGMRTERITLEVKHGEPFGVSQWSWVTILRLQSGESVRVVEEAVGSVDDRAYADRMGCDEERDFATRILAQRDAAIREREELRSEITSVRNCWGVSRFANDVLKARVAELEAAAKRAPHANAGGEANHAAQAASGGGEQPRGWLTGEERKVLEWALDVSDSLSQCGATGTDGKRANESVVIEALIARSSPPEVVKPSRLMYTVSSSYAHGWDECDRAYRSAIAASGVAMKEVGRE